MNSVADSLESITFELPASLNNEKERRTGGFELKRTKGENGQESGVAQIDLRTEFPANLYMMILNTAT